MKGSEEDFLFGWFFLRLQPVCVHVSTYGEIVLVPVEFSDTCYWQSYVPGTR